MRRLINAVCGAALLLGGVTIFRALLPQGVPLSLIPWEARLVTAGGVMGLILVLLGVGFAFSVVSKVFQGHGASRSRNRFAGGLGVSLGVITIGVIMCMLYWWWLVALTG